MGKCKDDVGDENDEGSGIDYNNDNLKKEITAEIQLLKNLQPSHSREFAECVATTRGFVRFTGICACCHLDTAFLHNHTAIFNTEWSKSSPLLTGGMTPMAIAAASIFEMDVSLDEVSPASIIMIWERERDSS